MRSCSMDGSHARTRGEEQEAEHVPAGQKESLPSIKGPGSFPSLGELQTSRALEGTQIQVSASDSPV